MPLIIALIPVILLAAMVLFLAGLIVLLWTIHPVVATVVTGLTSLLIVFFVVTTTLPTFARTCSYHSPQASTVSTLLSGAMWLLRVLYAGIVALLGVVYR